MESVTFNLTQICAAGEINCDTKKSTSGRQLECLALLCSGTAPDVITDHSGTIPGVCSNNCYWIWAMITRDKWRLISFRRTCQSVGNEGKQYGLRRIGNLWSQKIPRKNPFIGGADTLCKKNLLATILSLPALADSSICLYATGPGR